MVNRIDRALSLLASWREEVVMAANAEAIKRQAEAAAKEVEAVNAQKAAAREAFARGDVEVAFLDLLLELPSMDQPDSAKAYPWQEARGEIVDEMFFVPEDLPEGWVLYPLCDEESRHFVDYLVHGHGWLLVTPTVTWLVVEGEMGAHKYSYASESEAREAITQAMVE